MRSVAAPANPRDHGVEGDGVAVGLGNNFELLSGATSSSRAFGGRKGRKQVSGILITVGIGPPGGWVVE